MSINALVTALSGLSAELKGQLIERLSSELIVALQAAAADAAAKKIAKIHAMRADRDPTFRYIEGILARAGIDIEKATDLPSIDRAFAAAGDRIDTTTPDRGKGRVAQARFDRLIDYRRGFP